jgi:hypothetical protein
VRVSWITFGEPAAGPDGAATSVLASLRYRVLIPIRAMRADGHTHQVVAMTPSAPDSLGERALQADVMIFSKSFRPSNERLAAQAKSRGIGVIFDVCDNHYENEKFGQHYKAMTALADQVVCNTLEMSKLAQAYCSGVPVVIGDPYEGPGGPPRFSPGEILKLLWFGHPSNLDSLQDSLKDLIEFSTRRPVSLTVLTQLSPPLINACRQINEQCPHTTMSAKPWSLEAQWAELAACDAVVIPSRDNTRKTVKSANRMIEALWAGKPVVAQPMPAYQPFEPWTPVRTTLSEGLDWLLASQAALPGLIAQAQDHIAGRYAPATQAKHWEEVIGVLHKQRISAS